jgi:predicted nucleic acid-binding protein
LSIYADTSFLVSLYTPDSNSRVAVELMQQVDLPLLLTPLGEVELMNTLQLRIFRRELTSLQAKAAASDIRKDFDEEILVLKPFSATMFEKAKQISQRRTRSLGIRALDLLHVASALILQTDAFYSFDDDQRRLARAEGLYLS